MPRQKTERVELDDAAKRLDLLERRNAFSDGWVAAGETWTYASADAPTFTFTISGDFSSRYQPGMRLRLTQTTVKYFIVTKVAYSAPNTTVTVYGGTDYVLANAAITGSYYSTAAAPFGFPLDPVMWTVSVVNSLAYSQTSPAQNTWYNLGSLSISIPIGAWEVSYQVMADADIQSTDATLYSTLSTANNSESDAELTCGAIGGVTATSTRITHTFHRAKPLSVSVKTTYYLNHRTTRANGNSLSIWGSLSRTMIKVRCAYIGAGGGGGAGGATSFLGLSDTPASYTGQVGKGPRINSGGTALEFDALMVWKGTWSASTAYILNDVVTSGGSTYLCIQAHTNQQPPNATYWQALDLLASNFKGDIIPRSA